jgi:hypothetical protein
MSLINTKDVVIFAHNFETDDNSSFLTLINKLRIENQLLNDSISNRNNNNNNLNSFEYTILTNINSLTHIPRQILEYV